MNPNPSGVGQYDPHNFRGLWYKMSEVKHIDCTMYSSQIILAIIFD